MIQTFPPVYSVPEARRPSRRQATPLLAGPFGGYMDRLFLSNVFVGYVLSPEVPGGSQTCFLGLFS